MNSQAAGKSGHSPPPSRGHSRGFDRGRGFSKLKAYLDEEGLTQAWLARELGVPPTSVSNWVRGGNPRPETQEKIGKILGVDPILLFPTKPRTRRKKRKIISAKRSGLPTSGRQLPHDPIWITFYLGEINKIKILETINGTNRRPKRRRKRRSK